MARWRVLLALFAGVVPALLMGAFAASGREARPASARAAKGAVKLVTPRGAPLAGSWQRWADRALVPTVAGRVRVRLARCPARPAAAGCVYTRRPRTVWLRPGLRDPRGVLLHELGHVFDLKVMNNRDRGAFRRIMARRRARWWRGAEPLAEQFAEAYSWCARYARIVSIAVLELRLPADGPPAPARLQARTDGGRRPARVPPAAGRPGGHAAASAATASPELGAGHGAGRSGEGPGRQPGADADAGTLAGSAADVHGDPAAAAAAPRRRRPLARRLPSWPPWTARSSGARPC